jgi:membrane-bound lytic murein transglycosylase D
VLATGCLAGCASHAAPAGPPPLAALPIAPFSSVPGPQVPLEQDRVALLIADAEAAFEEGRVELAAGRLVAARERFDRAVDLLLAVPDGARSDMRLSMQFESLLDRVSALEVMALQEGDGFTEAASEPAAIDELLAAAMFEHPQPAETTEETVLADLDRTPHDIPLDVNLKVLSYIELFQGRLREFMQAGLDRSRQYVPMIQSVFREEGVPLDLAFVPLVESAFKVTAVSRASARGMWQFMLGTAREHGLEQNWFIDERSDPEKATRAAAQYLRALNEHFGDWYLALASYNAGPGRVRSAISRAKTTDYWAITASTRFLPRETREYVPMILAAVIIARNPGLYGFEANGVAPLTWETVTIPASMDLRIASEWAGVSVEAIRELNPELRRTTTPNGPHQLKVPIGTAATLQNRIDTADPSMFVHFDFHTVRRGDTLSAISRRFGVRVADLQEANGLRSTRLRINQTLTIPSRPAVGLPTAPRPAAVAAPTPQGGPLTYRVRRGDTLIGIARQFSTTVATLKRLNQLASDRINIGDRLTVRR